MASPQKERGYVPIANELLDAICRADLSKQELKVLLCIIRFTYGYNRKQALISLNTIQKYTSIRRSHISETVSTLIDKNIIVTMDSSYTQPRTYEVQKDYEKWAVGVPETGTVPEIGTEVFPKREQGCSRNGNPTYKYNNKDNYTNTNCASTPKSSSDDGIFVPDWFEEIWQQYPLKRGKSEIGKKHFLELGEAGRERVQRALDNYKAELRKNTWQNPMHGSRFFNGSWKDYDLPETQPASSRGMSAQEILDMMRREDEKNGKR